MKLHSEQFKGLNAIVAYGADYVQVNEARHTQSLVVLPLALIAPWGAARASDLTDIHFAVLANADIEIVLLGTGAKQQFIHPRITRALLDKRIGIEMMDTQAACRTYNILLGEGRNVAAALILETA